MGGPNIIPLPHIYGARIKGVEVFCPLDPPPPYEAVVNQTDRPQVRRTVSLRLATGRTSGARLRERREPLHRSPVCAPQPRVCTADLFQRFTEPRGCLSRILTNFPLFFPVIQASSFQMSGGSEAARSPMEQDCMTMIQGNKPIFHCQNL